MRENIRFLVIFFLNFHAFHSAHEVRSGKKLTLSLDLFSPNETLMHSASLLSVIFWFLNNVGITV